MGYILHFFLPLAFQGMSALMVPVAWLETCCLHLLGIDEATTFRMHLLQDAHPGFPTVHSDGIAFIHVVLIPWLFSYEHRMNSGILSPVASRCSGGVKWLLMLARVWLVLAFFNYSLEYMIRVPQGSGDLCVFGIKLVLSWYLLFLCPLQGASD